MAFPTNGDPSVQSFAWGMVQYPTALLPPSFKPPRIANTWWFKEAVLICLLMPVLQIVAHTLHTLFLEGAQIMYQVKVVIVDAWKSIGFPTARTLFWCNATDLSINGNCRQMLYEYMTNSFGAADGRARYFYSRGILGFRDRAVAIGRRLPRTMIYNVREPNQAEQDLPLRDEQTYSEVAADGKQGEWKITTWGGATQATRELTRQDASVFFELQSLTEKQIQEVFGGRHLYDEVLFFLLACPNLQDHTEYGLAVYRFQDEPIFWQFGRNEARLLTQNRDVLSRSLQMLTSRRACEDAEANTMVNGRLVAAACSAHRSAHVELPLRHPSHLETYVGVARFHRRFFELRRASQVNCMHTFLHYLSVTCHHRAQFDCLALAINVALAQSAFFTMREFLREVSRSRKKEPEEQLALWVNSGLAVEPLYAKLRFPVCIDNELRFCKLTLAYRCKNPRQVQALLDRNFEQVCGLGSTRLVVIGCFFQCQAGLQSNLTHHAFVVVFVDAWHVLLVDAQQARLQDKVRVWSGTSDSSESARFSSYVLGFSSLNFFLLEDTNHSYSPVLADEEFQ